MATFRPTQANLARLSRRTGGLDKLAGVYKQQVSALTDDYSKQFGDYQKRVSETMAPFEAAMRQYQDVAQPQYQSQVADYNKALEDYRAQLAALEAEPVTERTERVKVGRNWYGRSIYEDVTFFEPKPIPTFSRTAPTMPDAPVAPKVEEFNSAQFDEGRKSLGENLQREVAERKASRMNATRRTSRTMLGGT